MHLLWFIISHRYDRSNSCSSLFNDQRLIVAPCLSVFFYISMAQHCTSIPPVSDSISESSSFSLLVPEMTEAIMLFCDLYSKDI